MTEHQRPQDDNSGYSAGSLRFGAGASKSLRLPAAERKLTDKNGLEQAHAPTLGSLSLPPVVKGIGDSEPALEVRRELHKAAESIAKHYSLTRTTATILARRGFRPGTADLESYLRPSMGRDLSSPWTLRNLDSAVELIKSAVETGGPVAIFHDYDVDGTTSAAMIGRFLRYMGTRGAFFAPDRTTQGYDLNMHAVDQIIKGRFKLAVVLDTGTQRIDEINRLKAAGIKVIVVDHHIVPEGLKNPADAYINPQQTGCGFSGGNRCTAGLVWTLVEAARAQIAASGEPKFADRAAKFDSRTNLPLAALGTIADVVPLIGENRVLAQHGIHELEQRKDVGLRALLNACHVYGAISGSTVAFRVAPAINALGRIATIQEEGWAGALTAVKLFMSRSLADAQEAAQEAAACNEERKRIERTTRQKVLAEISRKYTKRPSIFVVWGEDFHEGVVGIVASRIADLYHRPALILSRSRDSQGTTVYKGSGRSIPGVHLMSILSEISDLLVKVGGHSAAAGLTILPENLAAFQRRIEKIAARHLQGLPKTPVANADHKLSLKKLKKDGAKLVKEFRLFEPCGMSNPAPRLLVTSLHVMNVEIVKGRHMKLVLREPARIGKDTYITAFLWHSDNHPAIRRHATIDVICSPAIDDRIKHGATPDDIQLEIHAAQPSKKQLTPKLITPL